MKSRVGRLATAGVKYRQGQFDEGLDWSTRAAEHAAAAEDRAALGHAYFLSTSATCRWGSPMTSTPG